MISMKYTELEQIQSLLFDLHLKCRREDVNMKHRIAGAIDICIKAKKEHKEKLGAVQPTVRT